MKDYECNVSKKTAEMDREIIAVLGVNNFMTPHQLTTINTFKDPDAHEDVRVHLNSTKMPPIMEKMQTFKTC